MPARIAGPNLTRTASAEERVPPLVLQLLGSWDARLYGQPLRPLRSRKGQWLLALLLLQDGRAVERHWLAGLLWPDSSTSQGLYNLRRNLTDLRDALGAEASRLHAPAPHTLCLDLTGAEVDVLRFDAALAAGDPPSLERAIALYRGSLLMECCEEWITPERTAREQAYLGALETLAGAARARGEREAEGRYLRRALAVDPLREGAQQALMAALAAQDDLSAAVRVYHEYRQLLRRQASTTPGAEITALFEQFRARARGRERRLAPRLPVSRGMPLEERTAADPGEAGGREASTRCRSSVHLPHPVSSFVGREQEVRAIGARLTAARLVTLTGSGGVGKTRLAIQVAHDFANDHRDGVWFVDLARLAEPTLLPQAVAAVIGMREQPDCPLADTLQEFLRGKRALLLLDNCEHLLPACAELAEALLCRCPELRILATSRQALGLTGEVTWPLPGLSVPEAVQLFVERASAATPDFALTERSAQEVAQICCQLDGLPLAIELAAARLRCVPVHEITARLDDRFALLTGGSRTALPRQQTLRASMDWSYELLAEPERALLRRLSVFAGGWTLEAVASLQGSGVRGQGSEGEGSGPHRPKSSLASDPSPLSPVPLTPDVLDLLSRLVEKSLVVPETHGGAGPGRYHLLETVRQYARERLQAAPGEAEKARERHAGFYLELAERAAPCLAGPDQVIWLERLEVERDNLRAALDWSLQQAPELALWLAAALAGFWEERWHLAEGRHWLEAALARAGPARRSPAGAAALAGASALAVLQDDRTAADALREESLAIRREWGDQAGMAASLAHLAHLTFLRGNDPAARALYEESLSIQRERGDRAGIATALTGLGHLARREEAYAAARDLLEESLTIRRELGDRLGMGRSLSGLGDAARGQGDVAAARRYYEAVLAIWRELGDEAGVAGALAEISDLARLQGDYLEARRLREESLALWRAAGSRIAVLHSLGALGHLAREQGNYPEAHRCYADSLRRRQETGDPFTIVQSLEDFAELAGCEQQWERLARLLGAAEALREAIGKPLRPHEQAMPGGLIEEARAALGEDAVARLWAAGQAMSLERAVEEALQEGKAMCRNGPEPPGLQPAENPAGPRTWRSPDR